MGWGAAAGMAAGGLAGMMGGSGATSTGRSLMREQRRTLRQQRRWIDEDRRTMAPVREAFVTDALRDPDFQAATGRAATDVTQQFTRARGQQRREMARRGVRPDAGAWAGMERMSGLAEAGTRADAITQARHREREARTGRLQQGMAHFPGASPAQMTQVARGLGDMAQHHMRSGAEAARGLGQLGGLIYEEVWGT